jgi:simple sugar transport system permease protein
MNTFIALFSASLRMSAPYLLGGLGGLYTQKAGIQNLCLEGFMVSGALSGFLVAFFTQNPWLGVLGGMAAGVVISSLFALLTIPLGTNQSITSLALNIFMAGLSSYLFRLIFGIPRVLPVAASSFGSVAIPFLSDIPILGPIVFTQHILFYIAILLAPLLSLYMSHTKAGIKIVACGENPDAAVSRGINVPLVRYICVIFGGAMAGLAGTFLSIAQFNQYSPGMVAGRGYIAFALIIFGAWNVKRIVIGALLFGFLEAAALFLQTMTEFPYHLLLMLPYVVTIVALIISTRNIRSARPAYLGVPFERSH